MGTYIHRTQKPVSARSIYKPLTYAMIERYLKGSLQWYCDEFKANFSTSNLGQGSSLILIQDVVLLLAKQSQLVTRTVDLEQCDKIVRIFFNI